MADKAPKDASLQSTKQMLDELDALMERMLSLPVSELEDGTPSPPTDAPPVNENVKSPSLAASLTLLDTPEDEEQTPMASVTKPKQGPRISPTAATIAPPGTRIPTERRSRSKNSHAPIKPPHLSVPTLKIPEVPLDTEFDEGTAAAPAPAPQPELERFTNEVAPRVVPKETEAPIEDEVSLPHRAGPLVRMNLSFDSATMWLGAGGRLLRSQAGRMMLGLSGIALFFVAVGWVLRDWLGWNWQ